MYNRLCGIFFVILHTLLYFNSCALFVGYKLREKIVKELRKYKKQ